MDWELIAIGVLAIIGVAAAFIALFKTGKRETKLDKWLATNVVSDPSAPDWLKRAAQQVIDTELTSKAQATKGELDAVKAKLDEIIARLPK